MAKRTTTTLVDDLDGSDIPHGLGETVRFGIDGRNYEIDLTGDNAQALREALQPYTDAGRRIVASGTRRRRQ